MIWIDDDEPNGVAHPPGLSAVEARDLDCEFWSPAGGEPQAPGCEGCGHYLCRECASLAGAR